MDNPLTVSLLVTFLGMVVVFLAMALIYGTMQLLTALARDQKEEAAEPTSPAAVDDPEGRSPSPANRLRAAAIAVALVRARGTSTHTAASGGTTPWGEFYRHRNIGSRGRGRMG